MDYTYTMPQAFMDDLSVPTHWRLLGYLNGFFINGKQVWASNDTIAQKLNVSSRSIQTAVKTLEQMDIIGTKRTKNSRIITPNYTDKNEQNEDTGEKPTSRGEKPTSRGEKPTSMPDRNQLHPNSDNNSVSNNKHSKQGLQVLKAKKIKTSFSKLPSTDQGKINFVLNLMSKIDEKNKTYHDNQTQRDSCVFLIDTYSPAVVTDVILNVLPVTNKRPRYEFPHISTPYQLKENWSKVKDSIIQKQDQKKVEQQKKGNLYW